MTGAHFLPVLEAWKSESVIGGAVLPLEPVGAESFASSRLLVAPGVCHCVTVISVLTWRPPCRVSFLRGTSVLSD